MAPAIHPIELVDILRRHRLTPAIVFLTSRRACDDALDAFTHSSPPLSKERADAIQTFLATFAKDFPSIDNHPLIPVVQAYGVAAHHAGHLPSWKIAIEELMRGGYLDAVLQPPLWRRELIFPRAPW